MARRLALISLLSFLLLFGCSARRARTQALPVFRDITEAAGLDFVHQNGAFGKKYLIEIMGAGAAFLDYDNDGRVDVLLVNGSNLKGETTGQPATVQLFRNVDGTHFKNVTLAAGLRIQGYGMGCCVGDFDNDGFDDIYVTTVLGRGHLLRNRGNGTFEDFTESAGLRHQTGWESG